MQLLRFFDYISVFLVPLTAFKAKTQELKSMVEEFFKAKTDILGKTATELTALGVNVNDILTNIKGIELIKKRLLTEVSA